MITLNAVKRISTYANLLAIIVGGLMVYIPDLVSEGNQGYVMAGCSLFVTVCQFLKVEEHIKGLFNVKQS